MLIAILVPVITVVMDDNVDRQDLCRSAPLRTPILVLGGRWLLKVRASEMLFLPELVTVFQALRLHLDWVLREASDKIGQVHAKDMSVEDCGVTKTLVPKLCEE